jgi:hypothetical protein
MSDLAELFPGIDLGSAPREGYAARPIGRRRSGRSSRPRQHASSLRMLADLRGILEHGLGDIGLTLKRIERHVQKQSEDQAAAVEALDHMRVRLVALERHAGIRPQPEVPRHSRRRPLSND